ncbi:MAG: DUF3786 domain-containing protein [Desulfosalsimonas sp.]
MASEAPIFGKILNDYLAAVAALDLTGRPELLGVRVAGNAIEVPFFGRIYTIAPDKIADPQGKLPSHAVSVILCKYLLLFPQDPGTDTDLVTYKDFRDAAPYVTGFANTAEKPISKSFSGQISALENACKHVGGEICDLGVSCDLSVRFQALPRIPVYMLYNDADEDFPADCSLLFERRAARYLDMECLAMIGMVLAQRLVQTEDHLPIVSNIH